MNILGPLTTREQSFDGRRTLNNRGALLFVLLVVLTFGLALIAHGVAVILGTLLFFVLVGGGVLGASLFARDYWKYRR